VLGSGILATLQHFGPLKTGAYDHFIRLCRGRRRLLRDAGTNLTRDLCDETHVAVTRWVSAELLGNRAVGTVTRVTRSDQPFLSVSISTPPIAWRGQAISESDRVMARRKKNQKMLDFAAARSEQRTSQRMIPGNGSSAEGASTRRSICHDLDENTNCDFTATTAANASRTLAVHRAKTGNCSREDYVFRLCFHGGADSARTHQRASGDFSMMAATRGGGRLRYRPTFARTAFKLLPGLTQGTEPLRGSCSGDATRRMRSARRATASTRS